jgi:hypothetical protein
MTLRVAASPPPPAGPFAQYAATYLRHGYAPIPVRPGSKAPCISNWSRWCSELPPPELVRAWIRRYPDAGIAIALGPASGITALDLDHDVDGLHERILDAAGLSPVAKRGARAPTYFYRHSGERSRTFGRNGETVAEILSQGRLVILPPTIHPDTGRPYEWVTPQRLLNREAASLPPLNAAGVAALFESNRKTERPRRASPRPVSPDRTGKAGIIADALKHIPADDYHTWIQVGMALKSALGEAGFTLWDGWSSTSPKYDPRQMQAKWESFEPTRITAGSIFHLAGRHGWQRPARQRHR